MVTTMTGCVDVSRRHRSREPASGKLRNSPALAGARKMKRGSVTKSRVLRQFSLHNRTVRNRFGSIGPDQEIQTCWVGAEPEFGPRAPFCRPDLRTVRTP